MSKISDEIVEDGISAEQSDYTFIQNLLITLSVIIAAIFIGETLFGKNSLEVYLSLQKDKERFKEKINKIQYENAALQKEYFELNSLLPKEEDK
jgi:cell division protein FtsB